MDLSGKTISHYQVLERLGAGGMADVYRASDVKLGRTVALKVLPQNLLENATSRQRFLHEARAASSLQHPNICTIFEFDETSDGTPLISMELIEGETLRDRMLRAALSLHETIRIAIQCARGLNAAHARGIIHRDLKPTNIMIARSGDAKVLDFGLAKRVIAPDDLQQTDSLPYLTEAGVTLGTVAYMSPEQARGDPLDARSDLFSLGIILYQMVSGVHPFEKKTSTSTLANILTSEPPNLSSANVPRELERIISRCLQKQPQARYASASDLLLDLEEFERAWFARGSSGSSAPDRPAEGLIPRSTARVLLVLIQALYLSTYGLVFFKYDAIFNKNYPPYLVYAILALALVGAAVRLFVLSSVTFDDPETGRQFQRLFPSVFLIDTLWAFTPLLLTDAFNLLPVFSIPFLAYLPFSQRTLIRNTYPTGSSRL